MLPMALVRRAVAGGRVGSGCLCAASTPFWFVPEREGNMAPNERRMAVTLAAAPEAARKQAE